MRALNRSSVISIAVVLIGAGVFYLWRRHAALADAYYLTVAAHPTCAEIASNVDSFWRLAIETEGDASIMVSLYLDSAVSDREAMTIGNEAAEAASRRAASAVAEASRPLILDLYAAHANLCAVAEQPFPNTLASFRAAVEDAESRFSAAQSKLSLLVPDPPPLLTRRRLESLEAEIEQTRARIDAEAARQSEEATRLREAEERREKEAAAREASRRAERIRVNEAHREAMRREEAEQEERELAAHEAREARLRKEQQLRAETAQRRIRAAIPGWYAEYRPVAAQLWPPLFSMATVLEERNFAKAVPHCQRMASALERVDREVLTGSPDPQIDRDVGELLRRISLATRLCLDGDLAAHTRMNEALQQLTVVKASFERHGLQP